MKRSIRLYNVIFPIWLVLFFPPVILLTLVGNYIIDSLVLVACFYAFRLSSTSLSLKKFYGNNIFLVWIYGFLADFIGAGILFATGICGESMGLAYEATSAICYDPMSHPLAVAIVVGSILVSAFLIFLFNYKLVFARREELNTIGFKIAVVFAIVTAPWTFLIPTKLFY